MIMLKKIAGVDSGEKPVELEEGIESWKPSKGHLGINNGITLRKLYELAGTPMDQSVSRYGSLKRETTPKEDDAGFRMFGLL
jgi:hypothetical protein